MSALGPHAGFIIAAYAAAVVVLGALIAWIVADARRQERLLAELEARGVTRRSVRPKQAASGPRSAKLKEKRN